MRKREIENKKEMNKYKSSLFYRLSYRANKKFDHERQFLAASTKLCRTFDSRFFAFLFFSFFSLIFFNGRGEEREGGFLLYPRPSRNLSRTLKYWIVVNFIVSTLRFPR